MNEASKVEPPIMILREKVGSISLKSLNEMSLIFVKCFTAAPRNEEWDLRSAREYLLDEVSNGGWFYIARNADRKIMGFAVIVPGSNCNITDKLPERIDLDKIDYLSVVAVDSAFGRMGAGSALVKASIKNARERGISAITVRNRLDAVAIKKILSRHGFRMLTQYTRDSDKEAVKREIQILELSFGKKNPETTNTDGWAEVDIYCLQAIKLPEKVEEALLFCGRSIITGLQRQKSNPNAREDWRWKGWSLIRDDPRVSSKDKKDPNNYWAIIFDWEPLPPLAVSTSTKLVMTSELLKLHKESIKEVKDFHHSNEVHIDPDRTDLLLCVNDQGSFLLLVRFVVKVSPSFAATADSDKILSDYLYETINREDRGVLYLLKKTNWGIKIMEIVNDEIKDISLRWIKNGIMDRSHNTGDWVPNQLFKDKTVHTASIYGSQFHLDQLKSVHKIEEFQHVGGLTDIMSDGSNDVFVQLGWSFSTLSGLKKVHALNIVRSILVLQMSWSFMKTCRSHIYKLAGRSNNPEISAGELSNEADNALSAESSFNKFLISYKGYRVAISPKNKRFFCELEAKWDIDDDFALVKDMQDALRGVAQMRANKDNEKIQGRVAITLLFVGCFSVISFITSFKDYRELMEMKDPNMPTHGLFKGISENSTISFEEKLGVYIAIMVISVWAAPFLPQRVGSLFRWVNARLLSLDDRYSISCKISVLFSKGSLLRWVNARLLSLDERYSKSSWVKK